MIANTSILGPREDIWFVTGAAGFIGSNLCCRLVENGEHVIGYDDLSGGTPDNIDRIAKIKSGAFELITGDIRDERALFQAMDGSKNIIHLAAQTSVPKSFDDPFLNNAVNVTGFLNVLTTAGQIGAENLVYASSCAVYGENPALPYSENEKTQPLSPYAASKLINEHYAQTLRTSYPDMAITGLRLFNIFGPWQNFEGGYASVIPRWINMCLNNQQPVIYGDGTQTRDFYYVDNVIDAIQFLGTSDCRTEKSIFNLATGKGITLHELFTTVTEIMTGLGVKMSFAHPKHLERRQGDILHSAGDIKRAEGELDLRPRVGLRDGILRLMDVQFGISSGRVP